MSRTRGTNWSSAALAPLLFACGRTDLGETFGPAGIGGAGAGTLVTSSIAGQGSGTIGSSSVSTNSTSSVAGTTLSTSAVTTRSGGQPATTTSGGSSDGGGSWLEAVILERDETMEYRDPRIAMNDDGVAVVAWLRPHEGGHSVWATLYTPASGWSDAEELEDTDSEKTDPHVAIADDGTAFVLWRDSAIWSAHYAPGSGWEVPEVVTLDPAMHTDVFDLAMEASGGAVVMWGELSREFQAGAYDIWSKRYTEVEGWGTSVSLAAGEGDSRLAMDPTGNVATVWTQWSTIWSSHAEAELGWTAPENITLDEGYAPDVAMDPQGNVIAVWTSSGADTWANRYVVGAGWGEAESIDTAPTVALHALVGMADNGNAVAVWAAYGDGANVGANRYTLESGWGDAELIALDAPEGLIGPDLAVGAAGDAVAAWIQPEVGVYSVWANRYTPGVGWRGPEVVSAKPAAFGDVDVGIDGEGNAILVWCHQEGDQLQILASHSSRPE